MSDITLAADQVAVTRLLHDAETLLGTQSTSTSGNLGPFVVSAGASASFSGGTVVLTPPNTIEMADVNLHYSLNLSFGIDLNDFLPNFCIPQVCVDIPCVGKVCTPKICINWPTISIPFSYSDTLTFSADFSVLPQLSAGNWLIHVRILSVPNLSTSLKAAAILTALGLAIEAAVSWVPFIGPLIGVLIAAVLAAIGLAGITGLLGPLLTPFVSGLTFTIYKEPAVQQVLPAAGPSDPAVSINILSLDCAVQQTDKAELVVTAGIAS
ncbi:hypothetical protein M3A49_38375 [Paraburkholderia sp. CNPSo 3076]|uniref:hypothetical protein n=1 Tax=Paraburkholderia sp. CNPSo 3076 TaxID=2940936 RepID=UPI0022519A98|nr:hypothetical protein [Paraburkholderia sp. CNPSo 3076]MCX5545246.1 hypothetical protein [Paraburkholderia sp. CNPSo 3076]